jgi:hypothetical protein
VQDRARRVHRKASATRCQKFCYEEHLGRYNNSASLHGANVSRPGTAGKATIGRR